MKGKLAFKWIFQRKVMAFSPFSFTENVDTPVISFTPDDYSFPLCKLGREISYLHSLRFFQGLRAPKEQSQPGWFPPCPTTCRPPAEARTALALRSLRSATGYPRTPEQEGTMVPCCPPVAMPRPASRSGPLLKIPLFLYGDCLHLALHLDCFLCSNVVAFTKAIGAFMWREHGYVSRS